MVSLSGLYYNTLYTFPNYYSHIPDQISYSEKKTHATCISGGKYKTSNSNKFMPGMCLYHISIPFSPSLTIQTFWPPQHSTYNGSKLYPRAPAHFLTMVITISYVVFASYIKTAIRACHWLMATLSILLTWVK